VLLHTPRWVASRSAVGGGDGLDELRRQLIVRRQLAIGPQLELKVANLHCVQHGWVLSCVRVAARVGGGMRHGARHVLPDRLEPAQHAGDQVRVGDGRALGHRVPCRDGKVHAEHVTGRLVVFLHHHQHLRLQ
jgi:hypothetical protein